MAIKFKKGIRVRSAFDLSDDLLAGVELKQDPTDYQPTRQAVFRNGKPIGWVTSFDAKYWACGMTTKTNTHQSWGITNTDHTDWQTPAKSVVQHFKEHYGIS